MKIFVIGASGLVGSHCMHAFKQAGWQVIGSHLNYPTAETVLYNPLESGQGNYDLQSFNPDVIVHCAALTNVDYCELNERESERATVDTTQKVVDFCDRQGAKLIYISTDYVFDGASGPYPEDEKPNPINVYGKHKLSAEEIVKTLDKYLIARVTNVYGEEPRFKNFIARLILMFDTNENKTLLLPSDQFATPVYAGDIARMLANLIDDNKNGIYNLSSTDYYSRFNLANRVKKYFKTNQTVQITSLPTFELNQPAKRPLLGGLLNAKFAMEYPDFEFSNVDDFIKKTKNGI